MPNFLSPKFLKSSDARTQTRRDWPDGTAISPLFTMDPSYQPLAFGVTAGITFGMQLIFFIVAFALQIDRVTDLAGCANFIVLGLTTLLWNYTVVTTRQIVATALVCASRTQLAAYLLYRVCKRGHDSRFDEMRSKCLPFFGFWVYQMVWVYAVSAPLIYINATFLAIDPPLGALDFAGWALFGAGFALQVVADLSKSAFRSDPANANSVRR